MMEETTQTFDIPQIQQITHAIEAALFAASTPLSLAQLQEIFGRFWSHVPDDNRHVLLQETLPQALAALQDDYAQHQLARGFVLQEVAGGFCFRSNPQYAEIILAMHQQRPQRLSKRVLETLAIVAYRQPITKPEIDHIRGVDCGGALKTLLERNLLCIVGKKEEAGRPLLYGTTLEFLSFFNLPSLSQLPALRELHELNEQSADDHVGDDFHLKQLSDAALPLQETDLKAEEELYNASQQLAQRAATARDALLAQGLGWVGDMPPGKSKSLDVELEHR